MFELIAGGMSSLSAALDVAKALNATVTEARIAEVKLELGRHLFEAQQSLLATHQAQTTALHRVGELEAEIRRLKDWSSERERYELVATGDGGFAYMLKAGMRGAEPAHWLCARCFEDAKKEILQKQPDDPKATQHSTYACPECKAKMATHWRRRPSYPDEPGA